MNASKELYDKERNARFASELGEKIHRSLTDIESPTYGRLFDASHAPHWGLSGFPMNGASQALLSLEAMEKGYQDNRWFRYDQSQQAGGQVKANEKATTIKDYNRRLSQGFYPALFNADQIKGLPEVEPRDRPSIEEAKVQARKVIDHNPLPVSYVSTNDEAGYKDGEIKLAPVDAFPTEGDYHAHAIKALAQSTAHKDALDRFVGDSSKQKAMEAFRVNMASSMMCYRIGLPFTLGKDERYSKVWAEVAQSNPEQLVKAYSDAERICYQLGVHAERLEKTPLVEVTEEMARHQKAQQAKIDEIEQASKAKFREQAHARAQERNKERQQSQKDMAKLPPKRSRKKTQEQVQSM